jgi:metal-sulfur cluster biosynthetic enzyme
MNIVDRSIADRRDVPTPARVIDALHEIVDPEIGLDVVDLGLIYDLEVDGQNVRVRMTLTSVGCPVGPSMVTGVKRAVEMRVPGVKSCTVELVWEPAWSSERMSPSARAAMGW